MLFYLTEYSYSVLFNDKSARPTELAPNYSQTSSNMTDQSNSPEGEPGSKINWLENLTQQSRESVELKGALRTFSGSETIYRHQLNAGFCYTEGFRHFLRHAGGGAYWFADILATQPEIARGVSQNGPLLAILNVDCGVATLVVARDRKQRDEYVDVTFVKHVSFTDCPPGEWVFKLGPGVVGDRRVLIACLPNED